MHSYSQKVEIKGIILNSENKKPIPYANIGVIESQKGTSSHKDGIFSLTLDEKDLKYRIHISCLNYRDTIIDIRLLNHNKTNVISLTPVEYDIPEVIIRPSTKITEIVVNKLVRRKIHGGLLCNNIPIIHARHFPYSDKYEAIDKVKTIQICFRKHDVPKETIFQIRIYEMDTISKTPGKDLLLKPLIVTAKRGKINTYNIEELGIRIPKEGIFIGVEWLIIPENHYISEVTYQNRKTHKMEQYGPKLGAHYNLTSSTWRYWAGKWEKFEQKIMFILPQVPERSMFDAAISITLGD